MRSRPPRLPAPDAHAADAFIAGAERPAGGERQEPGRGTTPDFPWEASHVRGDVVKGYALRLPEPLYLKLKWVADQRGQSINALCREAVEGVVDEALVRLNERGTTG